MIFSFYNKSKNILGQVKKILPFLWVHYTFSSFSYPLLLILFFLLLQLLPLLLIILYFSTVAIPSFYVFFYYYFNFDLILELFGPNGAIFGWNNYCNGQYKALRMCKLLMKYPTNCVEKVAKALLADRKDESFFSTLSLERP